MTPPPVQAPPETKAQEASDPRCVPIKLSAPIPVGDEIGYPDVLRGRSMTSGARSTRARRGSCRAGRRPSSSRGSRRSGSTGSGSRRWPTSPGGLSRATGWRIARTPGLLDARDFFTHLAQRIFPCTDYVRKRSELDYTPAPDCFHDIFGHTPMIMHPRFANFYQKIGRAALNCRDRAVEEGLTRIYWFTVEFGLVRNPEGLRIYGNGIISSFAETQFSLTEKARKHTVRRGRGRPPALRHLAPPGGPVRRGVVRGPGVELRRWAARNGLA